jgi:hypothetical protein
LAAAGKDPLARRVGGHLMLQQPGLTRQATSSQATDNSGPE